MQQLIKCANSQHDNPDRRKTRSGVVAPLEMQGVGAPDVARDLALRCQLLQPRALLAALWRIRRWRRLVGAQRVKDAVHLVQSICVQRTEQRAILLGRRPRRAVQRLAGHALQALCQAAAHVEVPAAAVEVEDEAPVAHGVVVATRGFCAAVLFSIRVGQLQRQLCSAPNVYTQFERCLVRREVAPRAHL